MSVNFLILGVPISDEEFSLVKDSVPKEYIWKEGDNVRARGSKEDGSMALFHHKGEVWWLGQGYAYDSMFYMGATDLEIPTTNQLSALALSISNLVGRSVEPNDLSYVSYGVAALLLGRFWSQFDCLPWLVHEYENEEEEQGDRYLKLDDLKKEVEALGLKFYYDDDCSDNVHGGIGLAVDRPSSLAVQEEVHKKLSTLSKFPPLDKVDLLVFVGW